MVKTESMTKVPKKVREEMREEIDELDAVYNHMSALDDELGIGIVEEEMDECPPLSFDDFDEEEA